jgi:uncharacterized protein
MPTSRNIFATLAGIITVGTVIGILAALLQKLGNPANMGICVACFERDIAGALGLHRAAVVQYLRPEIPAFVLGSFLAALLFREFKPRGGSAPITRFFLGMVAMIGALVFLGCPWRAVLRLAGGDGNALFGIAGLAAGVFVGTLFFRQGIQPRPELESSHVHRADAPPDHAGTAGAPVSLPSSSGSQPNGVLFYSLSGPGAAYAPIAVSLLIGLGVGFWLSAAGSVPWVPCVT